MFSSLYPSIVPVLVTKIISLNFFCQVCLVSSIVVEGKF
jgi:hypothetical protein